LYFFRGQSKWQGLVLEKQSFVEMRSSSREVHGRLMHVGSGHERAGSGPRAYAVAVMVPAGRIDGERDSTWNIRQARHDGPLWLKEPLSAVPASRSTVTLGRSEVNLWQLIRISSISSGWLDAINGIHCDGTRSRQLGEHP
jgi:hypothetical protein